MHRHFSAAFGQLLRRSLWVCLALAALVPGLAGPRATVLLISLDGLRPDYLERAATPFLDRLVREGVISREAAPPFPSVTFSSHVTIATGVSVARHGITGNTFYDNRTGQLHRYAGDQALLEAEPLWITAERHGVRTLVFDWVNAHAQAQAGPITASYFGDRYTRGLTDAERLERVLTTWREDTAAVLAARTGPREPLRLVLAYTESPDKEGHRFGPDSPEVENATAQLDRLVAHFWHEARSLWQQTAKPADTLWTIVTSDHGMAPVETHVNLSEAAGVVRGEPPLVVSTGPVAHFFFDGIDDEAARNYRRAELRARLEGLDLGRVWARNELPEHWDYAHPHRTGDLVWLLPLRHAFNWRLPPGMLTAPAAGTTYVGAHGFDPREDPDMLTVLVLHRYPEPLGGRRLGPVELRQVHPTVLSLLGIDPSPLTDAAPINWAEPSD
jgi:hypothetical protein